MFCLCSLSRYDLKRLRVLCKLLCSINHSQS
nr:MAG TPA: hypothetical protein [Caudoviricetes sp.]